MKKILLMYAVMGVCAAFIVPNASCQPIIGLTCVEIITPETIQQKDTASAPVSTGKVSMNAISIKAARTFIKNFRNAKNVSWRKTDDGGYVAQFKKDAIETIVRYDMEGSWNYTLKKYAEKQMSTHLRTFVKSTFFDYAIMEVTEILLPYTEDAIIYSVLIKDGDNFKILRICNEEMEIINDYTKP